MEKITLTNFKNLDIKPNEEYTMFVHNIDHNKNTMHVTFEGSKIYKMHIPKRKGWKDVKNNKSVKIKYEHYFGTNKNSGFLYGRLILL